MADLEVEGLFTAALGLADPWKVDKVELNTAKRRIDFEVIHTGTRMVCPVCGKTSQVPVPWAREGSGFTMLFEALAISLCQELPVLQTAQMLRVSDKQLWRRIEHYVSQARAMQDMSEVRIVGIDETSVARDQHYITVVHDLDAKRLLFATTGRDHSTVERFAQDLAAHKGRPEQIEHVCMDMSAGYALGVAKSLPAAQISYDRFHVVALANEAMDEVRSAEWKQDAVRVKQKLGPLDARERRSNAFVEAMNGLLQQAKRAARGFKNAQTFISIAYLRMGKLTHLPPSPLVLAKPRDTRLVHRCV